MSKQTITLAGGCFWCFDALYRLVKGVERVEVGYTGGNTKNPTYKQLHAQDTVHAEAVQVTFDDSVINLDDILHIFWYSHNPTTLNRQGADVGTEYRSEIFYHNGAQQEAAERTRDKFATTIWDEPIVTQISELDVFYPAEDYHQDYYTKSPANPYCAVVIRPKLSKFEHRFSELLK